MRRNSRRLLAAVVLSTAAACSGGGEDAPGMPEAGAALPEGHPPLSGQPSAQAQGPGGVVLETIDAAGYTYVRLGAEDEEIWVAGPVTELKVGDTVQLANPMAMGEFTSKALGRTFENLYFADGFVKPGAAAPVGDQPAATSEGVVQETMSSGGYTYARVSTAEREIWIAGPETEVSLGDSIGWSGGMVMRAFTSSTLNRTFDEILFVNGLTVIAEG